MYRKYKNNIETDNFYEFILDAKKVKMNLEEHNFKLMLKYPFDATKGIKDEISILKPILQKVYDCQKFIAKALRFLSSILFSKFASHCILLVFKKL